MIDLTTLARVKALAPVTTSDATQEAILSSLITRVSAEVESYLRRTIEKAERTEIYTFRSERVSLRLKAYPVWATDARGIFISTLEVRVNSNTSFSNVPTLTRNTDYFVEELNGVVRLANRPQASISAPDGRGIAPGYVQVKYTGGMATTTAEFASSYPDIANAVDIEVLNYYRRRNSPEGSVRVGDASRDVDGPLTLTRGTLAVLDYHRRRIY